MQTLVYFEPYQKENYEKLEAAYTNIVAITNEVQLKQKYVPQEVPILIIMSQPSSQLLKAFSKYEWTKVLIHIGIRNTDTIKGKHLLYENLLGLEQHYEQCKEEQMDRIKKRYIEHLPISDALDFAYIKSLYPKGFDKKIIEKPQKQKLRIRAGIVTIVGNPELAKVISKSISDQIEGRVLVVDGDFLKPSMAAHFNVKKIQTSVESHLTGIDNTGLNIALDALSKGVPLEMFLKDIVLKVKSHLHLLLGNYNLHNYEHYEMNQLHTLLIELKKQYEVVILSVSDNIYDQMTMIGVHQGDLVVFSPENNKVALRYIYQILPILKQKQGISDNRMTVISFDKRHTLLPFNRVSQASLKTLFPTHFLGSYTNRKKDMKKLVYKIQERMI